MHETDRSAQVVFTGTRSRFELERLRPGVLLLRVTGFDDGEHGWAVLDELSAAVRRFGRLRLLIDGREVTGISTPVREAWTTWFAVNRAALDRVTVLVGSQFLAVVIRVASHFAGTDDRVTIVDDVASFERAVQRALAAAASTGDRGA